MATTMVRRGLTACIPRFATPRDDRFPTLGTQVGEFARRLGRPLMPWQQNLIDVAYEYDPETGLFRYDETDTTVPRQSGKTTITLAKKVHRLTSLARLWGPQRSTYTAQTRLAARKKLERDFAEVLRASRSFREVANAKARPSKSTEWRLSLNNGSESIQFGAGSFLQIDAPIRTCGHGDTLDDGTIDEAFAHEDDTVEAAMRPAMATRRNAQLWVISTAGDGRSKYLWRKVLAGREATENNAHGRVCYVEYSAPDDADPGDPQTWWGCMPALGITINEDFIRGEWERAQRKGQEGVDTFRRAYLNQWPEIPVLEDRYSGVIPKDKWDALLADAPETDPVAFGIDMTWDREWVSIGWAVPGYVDVDEHQHPWAAHEGTDGTAWAVERCAKLQEKYEVPFWIHPKGPARPLIEPLRDAGVRVEEIPGEDYPAACGAIYDAIQRGTVNHSDHPALDAAVAAAQVSGGQAWTWDKKRGAAPISPLVAVTLALHGATAGREPRIRSLD